MQEWLELLEARGVNLMQLNNLIEEGECCHLVWEAADEVKALLMILLIMAMLQKVSYCTRAKGPKRDRSQLLLSHHLKLAHTLVRLSHKQTNDY